MCLRMRPYFPSAEPRTVSETGRWYFCCPLWWQWCVSRFLAPADGLLAPWSRCLDGNRKKMCVFTNSGIFEFHTLVNFSLFLVLKLFSKCYDIVMSKQRSPSAWCECRPTHWQLGLHRITTNRIYFMVNPLTLAVAMGTAIKHPVPDRLKPSFAIFDIRALWRSALTVRVPGCQKLQMTA